MNQYDGKAPPHPRPPDDTDLRTLGFSKRALAAVAGLGLTSVGAVQRTHTGDLLAVKGVGLGTVNEIRFKTGHWISPHSDKSKRDGQGRVFEAACAAMTGLLAAQIEFSGGDDELTQEAHSVGQKLANHHKKWVEEGCKA